MREVCGIVLWRGEQRQIGGLVSLRKLTKLCLLGASITVEDVFVNKGFLVASVEKINVFSCNLCPTVPGLLFLT